MDEPRREDHGEQEEQRLDTWVDRLNDGERVKSTEARDESEASALRWLEMLNSPGSVGNSESEGLVGNHLGPYLILSTIAEGGQGRVYEAVHDSLERKVALKVLPHQFGRTPKQIARFGREARAAASLTHEGIVPIYEVGEADGIHYYAMEYVDGAPLSDLIRERKRTLSGNKPSRSLLGELRAPIGDDLRWFVSLILDGAEAIGYAHRRGVVHRDIKPSNILVGMDGRARVSDFGLARIEAETSITRTGIRFGTLSYMSPEHVDGKALDTRSDVFSLGVTLYELVTLKKPFPGSREGEILYRISHEEPERPRRVRVGIDRDLEAIILRALEKDPDRRYPNGDAFAGDLRRYLAHEPVEARPWTVPTGIKKWIRRNPRSTVAVALLVLSSAVATYVVGKYQKQSEVLAQIRGDAIRQRAARAVTEGVLHLARGSSAAARVQFQNALALEPNKIEAELLLVLSLAKSSREGDVGTGLDRIDALLGANSDLAGAHFLRSRLLSLKGQDFEAERARHRAEELTSRLPVEIYLRAAVAWEAGRLLEALALFDEAIEKRPGATEYLFSRQRCYLDLSEDHRAFGDAWLIAHTAARDPWAHRNLGDVALMIGRTEEARLAYENCLELDPINAESRLRLSLALTLLGDGRTGEQELLELTGSLGDDPRVWVAQALARVRLGEPSAKEAVERALELDGEDPFALRVLGDCALREGNLEQARTVYGKASEDFISGPACAYGLGLVSLLEGDPDGAVRFFAEAGRPVRLGDKEWLSGFFWIRPPVGGKKGSARRLQLEESLKVMRVCLDREGARSPALLATYGVTLIEAGRARRGGQMLSEAWAEAETNHFLKSALQRAVSDHFASPSTMEREDSASSNPSTADPR